MIEGFEAFHPSMGNWLRFLIIWSICTSDTLAEGILRDCVEAELQPCVHLGFIMAR